MEPSCEPVNSTKESKSELAELLTKFHETIIQAGLPRTSTPKPERKHVPLSSTSELRKEDEDYYRFRNKVHYTGVTPKLRGTPGPLRGVLSGQMVMYDEQEAECK
ncbi:unnamed protein product [Acanthoscelides obtectus]|uniref:Uncharacterized protein n=1 Tax=Acanthoscelides obtectus TaxID=200917 RepID=A0A9P0K320_ACAOB|nr:unnamed protein product [Acanthoscelides obtectus]CAK1665936.1 hypothetical protein AOBTE_LOCUS25059 [Acanthoscelides obtectus]